MTYSSQTDGQSGAGRSSEPQTRKTPRQPAARAGSLHGGSMSGISATCDCSCGRFVSATPRSTHGVVGGQGGGGGGGTYISCSPGLGGIWCDPNLRADRSGVG